MKSKALLLLVGIMVMGITACGGGTSSSAISAVESVPVVESSVTEESKSVVESVESVGQGEDVESKTGSAVETQFVGLVEDGVFSITDVISEADEIIVPDDIDGVKVAKIKKNAFQELTCKTIILPDGVTSIGKDAFMECRNLETIELGEGLESIGSLAFLNCTSLKSVSFPEGMKTIKGSLFLGCDVLGDVFIPASVTDIPDGIGSAVTCPNLVIITPAGSVAEEVALSQDIPVRNS